MPTKKKCDKVAYLITSNDFCATILQAYKQGQRKMSTVNGRVKIKISQREDTKMSSFCIK